MLISCAVFISCRYTGLTRLERFTALQRCSTNFIAKKVIVIFAAQYSDSRGTDRLDGHFQVNLD